MHKRLESRFKPARANELGKVIRAVANRTPALVFEDGHESIERGGKRTTRRFMALSLKTS